MRQEHNIQVGETRVAKALKAAAPINNQSCCFRTSWAVNPIPYCGDYFGQKIHFDLIVYGVTHVAAIDGHTRYIVGTCMMPIKTHIVI